MTKRCGTVCAARNVRQNYKYVAPTVVTARISGAQLWLDGEILRAQLVSREKCWNYSHCHMKFERERTKPIKRPSFAGLDAEARQSPGFVLIDPVSEAQLRRGFGYMHGIFGCRCAILTDKDGSYLQVGGRGMTCCLEWRDAARRRHFRAFQQPPVVPWPGVTRLSVMDGDISLRQEEYFRIQQVTEAFLAFFHRERLPEYVQWRDITDELVTAGCKEF